jgi:hypothetical protein
MVLFLLAAGTRAWPASELGSWKFQTELGYFRPAGRIDQTFGGGVDAGFTVGRQLFSPLIAEAGLRLGDMSFSAAQTATGHECVPGRTGGFVCATGPTTQRATFTAFALGLSLPVMADGRGRGFQVGAGGLVGSYSISPGGESLGSRRGHGFYLALAVDLFPIGTGGSAGLLLRGTRVNTHGGSLGTSLPPTTSDTWLDVNAVLRLGTGKARRP